MLICNPEPSCSRPRVKCLTNGFVSKLTKTHLKTVILEITNFFQENSEQYFV